MKRYGNNCILVYGDLHLPFHDKRAFDFLADLNREFKPDRVVDLGDTSDSYNFSRYPKDPSAISLSEELAKLRKGVKTVASIFPRVDVMKSNHCFDDQTEVLTKEEGFILFKHLNYNHNIGTLNKESNEIEYQNPSFILDKRYEGDMIYFGGISRDLLVTPEHRMWCSKGNNRSYKMCTAESLFEGGIRRLYQKDSGINYNKDFDITDSKLKLVGWYLTDASSRGRQILFHQRVSNYTKITDLLNACGILFSLYEKDCSKITHICGVKLKKVPENQMVIRCDNFLKDLVEDRYKIPKWVFQLSQRQLDIFLDVLVEADGHAFPSRSGEYKVLYGTKNFLEQVQLLLLHSNYKASLKSYRDNDWKLNIIKRTESCIDGFNQRVKKVQYSGRVYCATVPNDTLVVRRNGKISITGNCDRLYSKATVSGIPRELIIPYRDLLGAPEGWKWHRELTLTVDKTREKVYFCHERGSNVLQLAKSISMNTVMGHVHSGMSIQYFANPLKTMFAVQCPCLVSDEGPPFAYNRHNIFRPLKGAVVIIDGVPNIIRL